MTGELTATKVKRGMAYLYQSWAPPNVATPGSYYQSQLLEGLAADSRREPGGVAPAIVNAANGVAHALGLEQFTGKTRAGQPVNTGDVLRGSVGIKTRPIGTDDSVKFEGFKLERRAREIETALNKAGRKHDEGRLTADQFESHRAEARAMVDELRHERERLEEARRQLDSAGLLKRQRGG